MPLWGNIDNANSSTIFAVAQTKNQANTVNRTAVYGNTTVGAFVENLAVGQFGVSAGEMANTNGESTKIAHAGWNLRTVGVGPLDQLTISNGGTLYSNTNTFSIASATGNNAQGTVTTDANGTITSLTFTTLGSGFDSANPDLVVVSANGINAEFSVTASGRAGRVQYETLVAMGSQNDGTSDNSILPQ